MLLGKLNSHMQTNETKPLSYITYKSQLKMDYIIECKTWTIWFLEENMVTKLLEMSLGILFGFETKANETKKKNKIVGLHQTKKLLHSKGNL